jgi:hypothetical protein
LIKTRLNTSTVRARPNLSSCGNSTSFCRLLRKAFKPAFTHASHQVDIRTESKSVLRPGSLARFTNEINHTDFSKSPEQHTMRMSYEP